MGGDGSGSSSFAATSAVASLRSIVSAAQKEEKENDRQKRDIQRQRKKNCRWGALRRWEIVAFQFHFNIKRCCW
jgi:hypothetical protein